MNSNTVNVVYCFNSSAVVECEYKINTIIGKADRAKTPRNAPNFKCFLKYEINDNNSSCRIQNYDNEEKKFEHVPKEYEADTFGPINTRLGPCWRKETNMEKRKRHLLRNEYIKNKRKHLSSCLLNDQQRLIDPRVPIAYHHEQQKQQYYNCNISKSSVRSIISEKEKSVLHANNMSDINYITTAEKQNKKNIILNNNKEKEFLCAKREKRWRHHKHRTRSYSSIILTYVRLIMSCSYLLQQNCKTLHVLFILLLSSTQFLGSIQGLLVSKSAPVIGIDMGTIDFENASDILGYNSTSANNNSSISSRLSTNSYNLEHEIGEKGEAYLSASKNLIITSSTEGGTSGGAYLDKLDNLERSLAAVLIKVAYGTTSTTKRSIPENSYVPSLTTIATPLLTTLRYQDKSHQSQLNMHHRNYELDLERDHALPTSAPNADILKSNSNPTYPNPNRHHNHERHRHLINSTPKPSLKRLVTINNVVENCNLFYSVTILLISYTGEL